MISFFFCLRKNKHVNCNETKLRLPSKHRIEQSHVMQNPILLFTKSSNKILEVSFGRGELKNGENLKGGREMKKHMTQASALLIFIFV